MDSVADPQSTIQRTWHLYVLECGDGSLYCGIALDVQKRLTEHQHGKGARYTRSRLPAKLVVSYPIGPDYGEALKAERAFKRLSRKEKLARLEALQR
ncbi:MAG: GIY-YIG nuclease family protein [Chthoniobacteraceae bacterium]